VRVAKDWQRDPKQLRRWLLKMCQWRFQRKLYRDDAVVLRVQKLGESDRIVTLFTRRHGRVRAVAKGVRRTTSGSAAGSSRSATSTCSCMEGRTLHVVSQVEGIELYGSGSSTTTRGTRRPARSRRPPSGSPRWSRSRRCGCSC
jgi:hypothetical protein